MTKTGQNCLTGVLPVLLFAAAFVLNGVLRWPLPATLALLAPLSLVRGLAPPPGPLREHLGVA